MVKEPFRNVICKISQLNQPHDTAAPQGFQPAAPQTQNANAQQGPLDPACQSDNQQILQRPPCEGTATRMNTSQPQEQSTSQGVSAQMGFITSSVGTNQFPLRLNTVVYDNRAGPKAVTVEEVSDEESEDDKEPETTPNKGKVEAMVCELEQKRKPETSLPSCYERDTGLPGGLTKPSDRATYPSPGLRG
ncbi:hypothetical protein KEM55_002467 [Ascosphaera atra]|nr:hypothetical protein KEM55_002467 [Ascosphaera atra]